MLAAKLLIFSLKNKKKLKKYLQKTLRKERNGVCGKCAWLVVLIIKNQKDFNENNSL
jgi:hypothetical protein